MRKVLSWAGLGLGLLAAPAVVSAQKALVYCPVTIDRTGCDAIAAAITGSAFPGGVHLGYDGSDGTVDLRTVNLFEYHVFLVPSLADDPDVKPYAFLRDSTVAGHLKAALLGELVGWSGMPDQGTANRGQKDQLIRNLAALAGSNFATANGPGLVAFLDLSDDEGARYDWLRAITPFRVNADVSPFTYDSVRALSPAATAALAASGGGQIGYPGMAAFGFMTLTPTPGISLDAVGSTGTSQGGQVVMVSLAAANTSGPVITTDKLDYAPGDTVTFSGSGWEANEVITLSIHEDPLQHSDRTIVVTADALGSFTNKSFAIEQQHLLVRFVTTATGGTSGSRAQTTFTDGRPQGVSISPASITVTAGGVTGNYTATVDMTGTGGSCTISWALTGLHPSITPQNFPSSTTSVGNGDYPITFQLVTNLATPLGSDGFTITGTKGAGCDVGGASSVSASSAVNVVATKVWTGTVSSAWGTAANWSPAVVPLATESVVIPSGTPNQLNLTDTRTIRSFVINSGATVTMTTVSATLFVNGDWRNSGTFDATFGTVLFGGVGSANATWVGHNQFAHIGLSAGANLNATSTPNARILVRNSWTNHSVTPGLTGVNPTVVMFNGSGTQTIGGSVGTTFHDVAVSNTSTTLGVDLTPSGAGGQNQNVVGNLTVNSAWLNLSDRTMNRTSPGGSITIANGATLYIGGTNTFPANYANHNIGPTSTVFYTGTTQTVAAESYGHLSLGNSGAGTKTVPSLTTAGNFLVTNGSTANATGDITVNGNWTVSFSATFNPSAFTHRLRGNLVRTANWTPVGTLILDGTTPQTLTGTPGVTSFNNLTIDNAAGVTLNQDHFVNGLLSLSKGVLTTGTNSLQALGTVVRGSGASCTSGTSCFVDGNLRKFVSSANPSRAYEIGRGMYSPATLTFTGASAVGAFVTGTVASTQHSGHAASGLNTSKYVSRYWTFTNGGLTFTSYDAHFQFAASDLVGSPNTAALAVRKLTTGTWSSPPGGSASTATTATGFGFTSLSDFVIAEKQDQTITFGALANKTYGDADFNVSATASSGQTVTFSSTTLPVCTVTGTLVHIVAAGTCTIAADQAGNDVYNPAPQVTRSFEVERRALTIAANDRNKVYGEAVTFAGTEFTPTGLINTDNVASVTLASAGAAATATFTAPGPTYAITPSDAVGTGLENYDIDYDDGTLTIGQKGLTIDANDRTKTYGDAVTFAGTEFTPTGLVNGDLVTSVTLTSAGAAATATFTAPGPTYAITPSAAVGPALGNYDITYTPGVLTLEQRDLAIDADDRTKTYGDAVTFAGTEFTAPALVNGDAVTSVTLTSSGAAATATYVAPGPTYAITPSAAQGSGLGNYDITYTDGVLTIEQRDLTIDANDRTKTYGEALILGTSEFTASGLAPVNGDAVTAVTLSSAGAAATATYVAPGPTYTITPSAAVGSGLGNYDISYTVGTLTIGQRDLTIDANDRSKTYGDALVLGTSEFTATGLAPVNGDAVTAVTLNSAGAAATATFVSPGPTYTITPSLAVGSGLGNYDISYTDGTLTIGQRDLTIDANDRSKTYGDALVLGTSEFTATGLAPVNGDAVTSVTLNSAGAAATATYVAPGPTYTITPSLAVGSGLGNYDISYTDGTLTIGQRDLTIDANDRSKTYGDALVLGTSEFTATGLAPVNGDAVTSVTLNSAGAAATATFVAPGPTYTITPSAALGSGLGNYDISYTDGTLTIGQRDLTIDANDRSKTYGDALVLGTSEFTATGLAPVNGDAVTSVTLNSAGAAATATYVAPGPTYTITPSAAVGSGLGNYDISYTDGTLTIEQRDLTIDANDRSKTYGDALVLGTSEFTATGLAPVNGDAVTAVTLNSAGAAATATYVAPGPTYTITPSAAVGSGLGNYDISYTDGALTIGQRDLTIDANDRSKTYGDALVLGTSEFTATGLAPVNGDAVTSVTLNSAGAAATATFVAPGPTYTITPSAAVGSGLENYDISYTDGTLTIGQRDLTIDANDRSKTYGDALILGTTEFTATGLAPVNGDAVTAVTLNSAGAAPTATYVAPGPTYTITPSAAVGSGLGNYDISYTDGTLTIGQRDLTIDANDRSKTYGDALVLGTSEFTATGLAPVNGDAVTSVTLNSAGAAATATFVAPGPTYTITPSAAVGSGLGNYDISYTDGTLTIGQRDLTIDANDRSKTYGDALILGTSEFTATGLAPVNGDAVTSVTLNSAGAAATATYVAPGPTYAITPSLAVGSGLGNYDISYTDGTLTIGQRDLTIDANDRSKTYGDALIPGTTEFTATGLAPVNGDAVTAVTLNSAGAAATATYVAPGPTYAITPSQALGSGLENYDISYTDGTLTIGQRDLTIDANDRTKTYGDALVLGTSEFTATGLAPVNGDAVTAVTLNSAGAAATATYVAPGPTYAITPSAAAGSGLDNYDITYTDGTLTIGQRDLTIDANDRNKTYGDALVLGTSEFTATGLAPVNGDAVTAVTLASDGAAATATYLAPGPTYPITASAAVGSGLLNYDITYTPGTLTLEQRDLTIDANDRTKVYGDALVLGTSAFTPTGLVNGDQVTSVTLSSPGAVATATYIAPGPVYLITPSAAVGPTLGNYDISYTTGELTLSRRPLTVSATGIDKVYDGNKTAAVTLQDDRVNSDVFTVSYTLAEFDTKDVGQNKPVSVTGVSISGAASGNYSLQNTVCSTTANITELTINVTAQAKTKQYGTADPALTYTFSPTPLPPGDAFTGALTRVAGEVVNGATGYEIQQGTLALSTNFILVYTPAKLTITQAPLSVVVDAKSRQYGDPNPTLTGTLTGVASPGGVGPADNITATYATTAVQLSPVSGATYPITATLVDPDNRLGNYYVTNTPAALTITHETAVVGYSGFSLFSTSSPTSGTATVQLEAIIEDPTDPTFGDARTAQIRFVAAPGGPLPVGYVMCSTTVLGLVTPGDLKAAKGSCNYTASISQDAEVYPVHVLVGPAGQAGNYVGSTDDPIVITVVKNVPGRVSGGGFTVNLTAGGMYAPDLNKKTNYGFNVNNNKTGKNLQGKVNIVFRRGSQLYQIKSSSTEALNLQLTQVGGNGNFETKASLYNITNPLVAPVLVQGGLTLKIAVEDNGEPGNTDRIGIALLNGTSLIFSTNLNAPTALQQLGGGNMQVR